MPEHEERDDDGCFDFDEEAEVDEDDDIKP
jgi:hypothetical protein